MALDISGIENGKVIELKAKEKNGKVKVEAEIEENNNGDEEAPKGFINSFFAFFNKHKAISIIVIIALIALMWFLFFRNKEE
jgi:multidrug efflux pump subunit AcrB